MRKHSNEDNGCTWYYEVIKEEHLALGAVGRCGSDSGWLKGKAALLSTQTWRTRRGILPGTRQKTEGDCVASHVFHLCAPSPRKKAGMGGDAGGGWRQEVKDISPNPAVAWGTLRFLQPISGQQNFSGPSFWRWYFWRRWTGAVLPLHLLPIRWAAACCFYGIVLCPISVHML